MVNIEADPDLSAALGQALGTRGIAVSGPATCPALRAQVRRRGPQLSVTVLEADGRQSSREVSGVEAAATFIESWARSDISASLRAVRPYEIQTPPAPAEAPAPRPQRPRFALRLALEAAYATDRSAWLGASVLGCLRLGPACAGLLLRSAGSVSQGTDIHAQNRVATDLLVAVRFPIALRWPWLMLEPGLSLGVGWLREAPDPMYQLTEAVDFGGLRAGIDFTASLGLGRGLALDLGVSFDGAFLSAGTETFNIAVLPPPGPPPLPPPMVRMVEVPGPPWGLVRAALGLRWSR